MSARWFSIRLRLGFLLRAFRLTPKPTPSAADISSARVALTMVVGCGEAMGEACRTAVRDLKAAGVVDASLDATLRSTWGVAEMAARSADRELRRLGIR